VFVFVFTALDTEFLPSTVLEVLAFYICLLILYVTISLFLSFFAPIKQLPSNYFVSTDIDQTATETQVHIDKDVMFYKYDSNVVYERIKYTVDEDVLFNKLIINNTPPSDKVIKHVYVEE
jgi:hypothetical protein